MTHSPHELTPRTDPYAPCGVPALRWAVSIPHLHQVFVNWESRIGRVADRTPDFAPVNHVVHINYELLVDLADAAGAHEFLPTMPREATI